MFTIEEAGDRRGKRLVATSQLSTDDFRKIAQTLGSQRARKTGLVAARVSERGESITTRWNGEETTNTANPGDWLVTSLSPSGDVLKDKDGHENTYVIRAASFPAMYDAQQGQNEFGRIFKAKGTVETVRLPGGFDIVAPWGEKQVAPAGYLVLNGDSVYGNNAQTFEATHEMIG